MRKLNRNRENLYTDSHNSEGYRQLVAVPAPRVRRRAREIHTYHVFISHRYARSDEYRRLVRMLDRAAERDSRWRWRNLSVPQEAPIMTQKEAKQGEVYEQRIRERMRKVDVVLLIDRAEWLENVNSLYLELAEGTYRHHRPAVPMINVLPRGVDPKSLKYTGPGVTTVKWHPAAIIQAIYRHAIPASASAQGLRLRRGKSAEEALIIWLTPAQCAERACIAEALKANAGHLAKAAAALGMSRSTLRRRIIAYLMGG
jgi:Bacterial regulatory protein, Fis family/MTH538 TIR-like domain (DUF1863)